MKIYKKLIPIYFIIICSAIANGNLLISQISSSVIFDATFYRITKFYSVDRSESYDKFAFIQLGVNYNPNIFDTNLSGAVLKYDNMNNQWYQPFNRFLRPIWCSWQNPFHLYCNPITTFTMSSLDTFAVIKDVYAYCGGIDGGEGIFKTQNGGINYENAYYGYITGSGCKGVEVYSEIFGYFVFYTAVQPNQNNFTVIYENGIPIDSLYYIKAAYRGGFLKLNPFYYSDLFLAGDSTMFLSTNFGRDFFSLNIPPLKMITFSKIDSSVYGITSNKVFKSTNNGLNWSSYVVNDSLFCINLSPLNSNRIYLGGKNGLYLSTNSGLDFNLYNNDFSPSEKVIGISKDSTNGDTVIVSTEFKVYKVWQSEIVNSIINITGSIPVNYSLSQNYPNPFNPVTQISFDIPKSSIVNLVVYDALGKEIEQLVNEELNPGSYKYEWNASSNPSGIYFYKLQAGEFVQTKKMVLIK